MSAEYFQKSIHFDCTFCVMIMTVYFHIFFFGSFDSKFRLVKLHCGHLIYHANFTEYPLWKFNLITVFMILTLIKLSVLIFYYSGSFMWWNMDIEELFFRYIRFVIWLSSREFIYYWVSREYSNGNRGRHQAFAGYTVQILDCILTNKAQTLRYKTGSFRDYDSIHFESR